MVSGGECKKGDRENMRKGSSVCLLPSLHQPPPCYIAVPFIMTSMELLRCPPAPAPYLNDDLAEEEKHRRILFAAKFLGEGVRRFERKCVPDQLKVGKREW